MRFLPGHASLHGHTSGSLTTELQRAQIKVLHGQAGLDFFDAKVTR